MSRRKTMRLRPGAHMEHRGRVIVVAEATYGPSGRLDQIVTTEGEVIRGWRIGDIYPVRPARPASRVAPAEEVARLYRKGRTLREIADQLGTTPQTVRQRLAEAGVDARPPGPRPKVDAAQAAEMYSQGLTTVQIAERLGVSRGAVRTALRDEQIGAALAVNRRRTPVSIHVETVYSPSRHRSVVVVWADRWYDACRECGHAVPVTVTVPVAVTELGTTDDHSQECRACGQWQHVVSRELPGDASEDDIAAARREVAQEVAERLAAWRDEIRAGLRDELAAMLALPEGQRIETGSDVEPGVYRQGGRWVAWAYEPGVDADPVDTITVTEDDLGGDR